MLLLPRLVRVSCTIYTMYYVLCTISFVIKFTNMQQFMNLKFKTEYRYEILCRNPGLLNGTASQLVVM